MSGACYRSSARWIWRSRPASSSPRPMWPTLTRPATTPSWPAPALGTCWHRSNRSAGRSARPTWMRASCAARHGNTLEQCVNQGGNRGHGDYQANDQSSSAGKDQQHGQNRAAVSLLSLLLLVFGLLAPKALTKPFVTSAWHAHAAEVVRHDLLLDQLLP